MNYIKGGIIVKTGANIFKMQFRHMLARTEFKISLTVVLLVIATSFYVLCGKVYGSDNGQLCSAAYGWLGRSTDLDIRIMSIFYYLFVFFIGSMAFSDSQFVDRKIKVRSMILARCSLREYIASGALVSFLGGFLVMFIPFIFSQLISYIILPLHGVGFTLNAGLPSWQDNPFDSFLAPIFYNHPTIYNLIAILYLSFCAGALALLSFALSHYIKKGRLLIVGLPAIMVIVEGAIFPGNRTFSYYLMLGGIEGQTIQVYLGVPLCVLLVSCIMLLFKTRLLRDELS